MASNNSTAIHRVLEIIGEKFPYLMDSSPEILVLAEIYHQERLVQITKQLTSQRTSSSSAQEQRLANIFPKEVS